MQQSAPDGLPPPDGTSPIAMPAVSSLFLYRPLLPRLVRVRARASTMLLVMAVVVGAFGIGLWAIFLWTDYQRELRAADSYSQAALDALGEHVRRLVGTSDLMLNQLIGMLGARGVETYQQDEAAWRDLRNLARLPRYATVLTVFDAAGEPLVTSRGFGPDTPALHAGTYPFFQAHREGTVAETVIGPTLFHPIDGFPFLVFSRSFYDQNDHFQGVVMAAVRADEFLAFAQKLLYGPRSALTVVRDDGLILMRQPLTPEVLEVSLWESELFTKNLPRAPRGSYEATSLVDGEPRIVHYQKLEELPLVLVSALAEEEVLKDWWPRAYQTGLLVLLGIATIGALALFGSRHAAREEEVQRELEASRDQERVLMAELNHRSRNLLALVQSLVRQTARTAADKDSFEEGLIGRIQSLAKSHELLSAEKWQAVDLRTLVEREIRPFDEAERIQIEGEQVRIPARVAPILGMAIHELATNCAKHGALSSPGGRLEVAWRIEDQEGRILRLSWRESGGPRVAPPTHRGFGMVLLEHSMAHGLDGSADLDFRPEGLNAVLILPLDQAA